jgi:hypothetical protein
MTVIVARDFVKTKFVLSAIITYIARILHAIEQEMSAMSAVTITLVVRTFSTKPVKIK